MTDKPTRELSFGALLALGVNGIVGVGIFFLPDDVSALVPGMAGLLPYAITALSLSPVAATYATLGSRFEEDGGPYVWARAALGHGAAFAVGWVAFVSALFSTAAVVAGLSEPIAQSLGLEGQWGARGCAIVSVSVLTGVAATGLDPSARVWSTVTVLKLLPLLALSVLGARGLLTSALEIAAPDHGCSGWNLLRAMLVVVFATQGFEIVVVPAGHVRQVRRAVPIATFGSLAIAVTLYLALHAVCVYSVPDLDRQSQPLVAAAQAVGGSWFASVVAVGTTVSALGIAFGMFVMTPRYLSALGRGEALGTWIGHEGQRRVPGRALAVSAGIIALLVFVALGSSGDEGLRRLFVLSGVMVLTQYAVSAAALAVLAAKRAHGFAPRDAWSVPLVLAAIGLMALAVHPEELVVLAAVLIIGGVLLLVRKRLAAH